jgi:activator of HSP90 ATPase
MAKWGEGDARWIVTNREDGANVNNWHWTEMDFTKWAETRSAELLGGVTLENDKMCISTNNVTCKGEVTVNTRKQKTIFLYELEIDLKWEGELKSKSGKTFKGSVNVPYISEENDDDDFEVKVTVEETGSDAETLRQEARTKLISFLKEKIPQMLQEMRGTATGKTKLPPKTQVPMKLDAVAPTAPPTEKAATVVKEPPKPKGYESFTVTEKFLCSPTDLFECFIDNARVKAYAGGDASVSREKGGKFRLFGGSVEGENVEVDYPKKLVQKWRFSTWPDGHYSTVTITLDEKDGKTICKLTQAGVPSEDKERTERGWSTNFWTRIKGIFGYGSML